MFQVGVSAFIALFKASPESIEIFSFLRAYDVDNEEFYALLSQHSMRVLGTIGGLIKEVCTILQFCISSINNNLIVLVIMPQ